MKTRWQCWTLSRRQIDQIVKDMGESPSKLAPADYEVIAQTFIATLHRENEDWRGSIIETIPGLMASRDPKGTDIRCTDGDCIFQFDETCHSKEILVDDHHRCATRQLEGEQAPGVEA